MKTARRVVLRALLAAALSAAFAFGAIAAAAAQQASEAARPRARAHAWEMQEVRLTAAKTYANPYTDVRVWIDLNGPGFHKRVYGFWDGGANFKVRFVATAAGAWSWTSGSSASDTGLNGKTGSIAAVDWSETEKKQNALRHGFLRATANQHALQYADGQPFFAVGDTWYSAGAGRWRWYDDEVERPIGPTAGFKDYVRLRQSQGFNLVAVIASFPNWKTDDKSRRIEVSDSKRTTLREGWVERGTPSTKDMSNEGGMPFEFPGKVPGYGNYFPDVDKINPAYFAALDRKIAYLNAKGFVVFLDAARRDVTVAWDNYYDFAPSYGRYIAYLYNRYQAYNVVMGPVHLDTEMGSAHRSHIRAAMDYERKTYGDPPFGNLITSNVQPSTPMNWGEDAGFTLYQIGNRRDHDTSWYATDIYYSQSPRPTFNGEPYYAGFNTGRTGNGDGGGPPPDPNGIPWSLTPRNPGGIGGTDDDSRFARSTMYGSVLSGAFAGHIYGANAFYQADNEAGADIKMWEAALWPAALSMKPLAEFILSIGPHYSELQPMSEMLSPDRNGQIYGWNGWSYAARTPDRKIVMLYFEKGVDRPEIRGLMPESLYRAEWFDPRSGAWVPTFPATLPANAYGSIMLPPRPSDEDWALRLVYERPVAREAAGSFNVLSTLDDVSRSQAAMAVLRKYMPTQEGQIYKFKNSTVWEMATAANYRRYGMPGGAVLPPPPTLDEAQLRALDAELRGIR